MKKLLSIFLCAALLTGGTLSVSAAKTSKEVTDTNEIASAVSAVPDKINKAGQAAIDAQYHTTEDGVEVEPTAIGVVRKLDFPASKEVSYIRLFYYPNGSTPPAKNFYLITDQAQIETIRQALLATKAESTTDAYGVTGYDIKDYKTEFSMEVHTKDGVEIWNTLYGVDSYLMKLEDKQTGDYDDMPFVTKSVAPLTSVLNKLRANPSTSLTSMMPEQPFICKVDTKAHTFVSNKDLKASDRAKANASLNLSSKKSTATSADSNIYFRISGAENRFKFQQTKNGAALSLYTSSPNEYVENVSADFLTTFDSFTGNLPQHPSWFCGILDEPNIAVSYAPKRSSAFQSMYSSGEADMQKLLGKITVKKDSFQKVDKKYKLKNAFTLIVRDLEKDRKHINSTYTISVNDTQLLIQNDSVSYGALYTLDDLNGKEIWQQIEQIEMNHQPMPE